MYTLIIIFELCELTIITQFTSVKHKNETTIWLLKIRTYFKSKKGSSLQDTLNQ